MTEVGEVAREVLKLSRGGNESVGKMEAVVEELGMEIYDVVWNLLDLAGVDLEDAFGKKASLNVGREW
jgi:NTP pyrophosphatase (non-canonical NTP hydrolase)